MEKRENEVKNMCKTNKGGKRENDRERNICVGVLLDFAMRGYTV